MHISKNAFTMIELIFVIIVLGILIAVAVPKFAATRDDAKASMAAKNLTTCITDLSSSYTATGNMDMNDTNVDLLKDGCFTITISGAQLTVHNSGMKKTSTYCIGAMAITFGNGYTSATLDGTKVHDFSVTSVIY